MRPSAPISAHVLALYRRHPDVESAIEILRGTGYNMGHISIIGQNYEAAGQPVGFVHKGDRIVSRGKLGAFWSSLWGLLLRSAMIYVPGVGFIVFAGWIVRDLEGAELVGGLTLLGAVLAGVGTPESRVNEYEEALKAGDFVLLAHGSDTEVDRAMQALEGTSPASVNKFWTRERVNVT